MKVRCIRQLERTAPGGTTEGWISIDKEYEVLALYVNSTGGTLFRIIADDNRTPALFKDELFEISESTIPPNWIVIRDHAGAFRFSPKAWLEPGFWERYFDHDPGAIQTFEREMRIATIGGGGAGWAD